MWNINGQLLQTLNGHTGGVMSVAFSPDSKTIVTASDDNTVRLWNLNLDDLLVQGCTWLHDYLNNPSVNLSNNDRHLCDDISTGR
ncbi:hypothetical protein [Scytonema sp. UIC 10036]|uniref:WD40 repeat domain-containing protein n=1 Tax=Scytonema sp. UIC 10036 TaxID=2304196 RepID=UPI001FAA1B12|nr:hypothetical protein [Scytonema sp. UIC 10036]